MTIINYTWKLNFVLNSINRGRKDGVSDREIFEEIKQIIPPEVRIIEKETKLSEEQKQYLRDWRRMKKEEAKIDDERLKEQNKINNALKRENMFCFHCKKNINVDPRTNTHEIKQKPNRTYKSIIILNECPNCNQILRSNGGKL